jgi:hypothetical protein
MMRRLLGRAAAQAVSGLLPTAVIHFNLRSDHVGFAVNKVAMGQVSSESLRFTCQTSFYQLLDIHPVTTLYSFDTDSVIKS